MKYKKRAKKNKGCRINFKTQTSSTYHWKILGALVQDVKGYLSEDELYLMNHIIRYRDFETYLELDNMWGLQSINTHGLIESYPRLVALYSISSLLKKYLPKPDAQLDVVALKKVLDAESVCKEFNCSKKQFLIWGIDNFSVNIFTDAKAFLLKLLGESVPVKDVVDGTRHGPGANLDTCDGDTSAYAKYRNIPYSCTASAFSYATYMIKSDARWYRALKNHFREMNSLPSDSPVKDSELFSQTVSFVDHNRITFVAKNAKTSRSIAIEPALNLMLQLGVDDVIRRRLKRWGVDLDSQEPNRILSRLGSKYGTFATLDLQAASDTISLGVCEALLPEEWYQFLCKLRAPSGVLKDGTVINYNKMSSMGNGFTFALESAVFSALVYAVYKHNQKKVRFSQNAAVFGDDIIIETDVATDVIRALNLAGFSLNTDKSFIQGPVRESCGTDWFKGLPVRPIFFSEPPSNVQDLFVDYNRLRRSFALRFGYEPSSCLDTILKWIPKELRLMGPLSDEVFDSWLHSDEVPEWSNGFYRFTRILRVAKKKEFSASHLYGDRYFFQLAHNLREKRTPPLFVKKKIEASDGSRFTVEAKGFTVRRKPATCSFLHDAYHE